MPPSWPGANRMEDVWGGAGEWKLSIPGVVVATQWKSIDNEEENIRSACRWSQEGRRAVFSEITFMNKKSIVWTVKRSQLNSYFMESHLTWLCASEKSQKKLMLICYSYLFFEVASHLNILSFLGSLIEFTFPDDPFISLSSAWLTGRDWFQKDH